MTSPDTRDMLLYVVLPYIAIVLFIGVSVFRYRRQGFSYSALSSQTLENRMHYWGVVPFHYGILFVLTGHLLALFIPGSLMWWNGVPLRLAALEATGLAFAIMSLVGLVVIMARRVRGKAAVVSSRADKFLYLVLLVQIITGILVAVTYGWGSSWFMSTATPYIWSLVLLQPDITSIVTLPTLVQTHIVTAFLFVAIFPFTRMVHALVAPLPYLWRKPQMVRWWRSRA